MAARKLFLFLAFLVLAGASGCRGYCERNYPCPPPYAGGYAPYCPPAPAAYAPAAVPAGSFGPGARQCTCTCP